MDTLIKLIDTMTLDQLIANKWVAQDDKVIAAIDAAIIRVMDAR